MYVKIFGNFRIFKEERCVVGTDIKSVVKHQEVTNHFLKVFVQREIRVKGVLTREELEGQTNNKVAGREVMNIGLSK